MAYNGSLMLLPTPLPVPQVKRKPSKVYVKVGREGQHKVVILFIDIADEHTSHATVSL